MTKVKVKQKQEPLYVKGKGEMGRPLRGEKAEIETAKGGGLGAKKSSDSAPAKKTVPAAPAKKTGMDAVKALGKYVSTFGLATEKYNPAAGRYTSEKKK